MTNEKEEFFETSDIYIAAFLSSCGEDDISLTGTRKENKRGKSMIFFMFTGDRNKIERAKIGFLNNTASVKVGTYANQIKMCKQLCFSDTMSWKGE